MEAAHPHQRPYLKRKWSGETTQYSSQEKHARAATAIHSTSTSAASCCCFFRLDDNDSKT
ncbi:hypothetical protein E2C01_067128 [Portunus trituberculatus]|uniref:Uncharacterized protein n=1 Tax=Portunus trituberculatus TaxID=210409 RepID=A0A5B7HWN1_PORTR|nr:hypothetical protein [Portunus trituberculatus]